MAAKATYGKSIPAGENGWSEWIQPVHGFRGKVYREACCDCGLVHDLQYRIVNGAVNFRVRRNERATGAARRAK